MRSGATGYLHMPARWVGMVRLRQLPRRSQDSIRGHLLSLGRTIPSAPPQPAHPTKPARKIKELSRVSVRNMIG